jgi:predicted amidohydrolase
MPGTDQRVLSTDGGEIGVAICTDLGHPKLGPELRRGRRGAARRTSFDFEVDDWSQIRSSAGSA